MSWDYNISKNGGDALRRMVEDSDGSGESLANILEQLQSCCREVVRLMKDADDEVSAHGFEDLLELIEGEPTLCREQDADTVSQFGYDSFEELVNSRLEEFYDCCDDNRVWLGIGFSDPGQKIAPDEPLSMGGMNLN